MPEGDDRPGEEREAVRTAPIQFRRWMGGVSQRPARPFFGPVAWTVYAACALFSAGVFVLSPSLFPQPARDAFPLGDIGLSALLLAPFALVSTALHECGHWLAARAAGVRSRFGIDRRMMLLVFETVLQWTAAGLAPDPLTGRFWYALLCAALLLSPQTLAAALAVKEYARRFRLRRQA
ncbi:site-2 protease family protein [Nonomuraea sp. C10]|uniref:site-2 protease family protein n=1 Tax=Nonomuraea sp. C10 TaxID=2600577 RepID=UPI00164F3090|nr:site-2 protease family protein [Nonomuraea sp. C10]